MSIVINKKRFFLFIWMGLAYMSLWIISNWVSERETFFERLPNELWRCAYIIVVNFIFFEYTVPYVINSRKHILVKIFIGLFLFYIHLMLWSFGLYVWRAIGIFLHLYIPLRSDTFLEGVTYHFPFSVGSILFFAVIRHIYDYRQLQISTQQLRIEKQEAELNYLKSQTNPHFLFNTLNNIYSLSRDKSDLAPDAIMRLSKILRFMLYETGGDFIRIEQELMIIRDYIDLEKLRYDRTLSVNCNFNVEDEKQAIPPLLLIPLVENAFKHGVSETRLNPFIDIHLTIQKKQLTFEVKNSIGAAPRERAIHENIGLSNLRRQLELLYKEFELNVRHEESSFIAILRINLASHV